MSCRVADLKEREVREVLTINRVKIYDALVKTLSLICGEVWLKWFWFWLRSHPVAVTLMQQ